MPTREELHRRATETREQAEREYAERLVLNGDHAEFAAEHANTPPHDRPDWPLPSFDARDWAKAFINVYETQNVSLDEAWMTTWFANALMRGFDEHASRYPVEFTDRNRIAGKLKMRNGAWFFDGEIAR